MFFFVRDEHEGSSRSTILRFGFALLLMAVGSLGSAQVIPMDAELRETVAKVDVTLIDIFGRKETKPVVITVFRPPVEGRFPLLILNHGRAVEAQRHLQTRQRYLSQTRWFVERGFVVLIPTRVGYGETFSSFDPEFVNACRGGVRLDLKDQALLSQIEATLEFARTLPYVDATKWLIAGQSLGGYTAVTIARKNLPGLVGGINFAGGFGGDPDRRRGNPCDFYVWEQMLKLPSSNPSVPTLWVYWKNDFYWGDEIPQKWFTAFQNGGGKGEFIQLPRISGDGHLGFSRDMKSWADVVTEFLSKLPIELKQVVLKKPTPTPPVSTYALIEEVEKVPHLSANGKTGYRDFLTKDSRPRAFAINQDGKWGWSSGHWDATDRALRFCNNNARSPCRLYAVDEDVVWIDRQ